MRRPGVKPFARGFSARFTLHASAGGWVGAESARLAEMADAMGTGAASAAGGRHVQRIAVRLVIATMAYNLVEAGVALISGVSAGSLALVGFGFDSVIEVAAAGALLWRLDVEARGAARERIESTEQKVHRFVGATFVALAAYVTVQGAYLLYTRTQPEESAVGIALACASLAIMPAIAFFKLRAARELGSAALRAEARETLACSYLSLTLLVGLAANATAGWWWADPLAALLMVPWLVKEGLEGLRGERCEDCAEER